MTSKKQDNNKNLVSFFHEAGQLKRVKRSGWWLIGVKDPESVADHSHRTAIIGYFLAKLEKANVEKVVLMCLFNDIHEARINDLHKMGHKYIDFKTAEKKVISEQAELLGDAGNEIKSFMNDYLSQNSKEAIIARDADLLECSLQAKEYIDIGHKDAQNWIDNTWKIIKLDSSKKILKMIETTNSQSWYKKLKKIER